MIITTGINTPLGEMVIGATDLGICLLDFKHRKSIGTIKKRVTTYLKTGFEEGAHKYHTLLMSQLQEYFEGARKEFDVPLTFTGTTFQNKVWKALLEIPYGSKSTYLNQSNIVADEKAIRAVARANGENCLAIIVPCHRIIGSNGNLTGYAGGLKAKQWLLDHEAKHSGQQLQAMLF